MIYCTASFWWNSFVNCKMWTTCLTIFRRPNAQTACESKTQHLMERLFCRQRNLGIACSRCNYAQVSFEFSFILWGIKGRKIGPTSWHQDLLNSHQISSCVHSVALPSNYFWYNMCRWPLHCHLAYVSRSTHLWQTRIDICHTFIDVIRHIATQTVVDLSAGMY